MAAQRQVRLFRNGRNQAVRIPREFELPGHDAILRKEGDRLIIEPAPPRSLLALLATLDPIEDDFPTIEELPRTPQENSFACFDEWAPQADTEGYASL